MKKITLSIPEPCDKKWAELTDTGQFGCRFCDRCEKQIRDFTHSTDAEIAYQFHKNPNKICGKFRPDQLGRPIQIGAQNSVFGKAAGLIFGGLLAASEVEGQTEKPVQLIENQAIVTEDLHLIGKATPFEELGIQDSIRTISGKIVDDSNEALIGASIMLVGQDKIGTIADVNGQFSLKIPERLILKKGAKLIISYVGYKSVEKEIPKIAERDDTAILVELVSGSFLGEVVISKPNFRQKTTRFFKRIF